MGENNPCERIRNYGSGQIMVFKNEENVELLEEIIQQKIIIIKKMPTAPGVPRRSPIQVLTRPNVA